MNRDVTIKPIEILGTCPAGIGLDDETTISGMNVLTQPHQAVCFNLITQYTQAIWAIKKGWQNYFHASCPGCIKDLDNENRVICLIHDKERPEMGKLFTEYWRMRAERGETEKSKTLRTEAEELSRSAETYNVAVGRIKEAISELGKT